MANNQNPTDLAREAFKQLAARRITPTPENYQRIYEEVAGVRTERVDGADSIAQVLQDLAVAQPSVQGLKTMAQAAAERNWSQFGTAAGALAAGRGTGGRQDWAPIVRDLVRQIEMRQSNTSLTRKKDGLEQLLTRFGSDAQFADRLHALVRSWAEIPESVPNERNGGLAAADYGEMPDDRAAAGDSPSMKQLREMLGQTLEYGVAARLSRFPDLVQEANELARQTRETRNAEGWTRFSTQLKQFWYRVEMRSESDSDLLSALLSLVGLLVNNVGELVEDEQWVSGQVALMRNVLEPPLTLQRIQQAERSFKDVVYKQSMLKVGLRDAKATLKHLITMFVQRLTEMTDSTAGYHGRIGGYADRLKDTNDMSSLKSIVDELMSDTRSVQGDILRRLDEMIEARKQAEQAEQRVRELEAELEHVSEQVREDKLTGTLNRRGLDEAMQREVARAERRKTPLCIAVLDLDNFKRLNDTYGHRAGDDALVHLANVVKKTLRPTDIVARFGGEEFLLLYNDTPIAQALDITRRLQRELTKQFFMHNHERLLITFSAGVALFKDGETQEEFFSRADRAMYQAKLQGKNRVVAAEE